MQHGISDLAAVVLARTTVKEGGLMAVWKVDKLEHYTAQVLADWRNLSNSRPSWSGEDMLYDQLRDVLVNKGRVNGLIEAVAFLKNESVFDARDRIRVSVSACPTCDKWAPRADLTEPRTETGEIADPIIRCQACRDNYPG